MGKKLCVAVAFLVFAAAASAQDLRVVVQKTTPLQTNTYLLYEVSSREAAVVDPGGPVPELLKVIEANQLTLKYILVTHAHWDHVVGFPVLHERFPSAKLAISREEMEDTKTYAQWRKALPAAEVAKAEAMPGFVELADFDFSRLEPEIALDDGQTYRLGQAAITTLRTPGHSRGSICFHVANMLFSGDVLFYRRTGRTDLPGAGGPEAISRSIARLYERFPGAMVVHPGHGQSTDIGAEKAAGTGIKR